MKPKLREGLRTQLPTYALLVGTFIFGSFFASVFTGGDWSESLGVATWQMAIAAVIFGHFADERVIQIAAYLGGPFLLIESGLMINSVLEGGEGASFWREVVHVGSALILGTACGRIVALMANRLTKDRE